MIDTFMRDDVLKSASAFLDWSWSDKTKHPKDRLTDAQALDIALRYHESKLTRSAALEQSKAIYEGIAALRLIAASK